MKVLKIRTLEKGWCDKYFVMLHAVFQLLVDFVEQEKPDQIVDWNSDLEHKQAWKEIRSLYRWWTDPSSSQKSSGRERIEKASCEMEEDSGKRELPTRGL